MIVFKLLSDCQKLSKIRKIFQGPRTRAIAFPGPWLWIGGIVSFILFELLFSNCSKIVKNLQKSEYFSRGFAPDPTRACNPWTLLVGALLPSYFLNYCLKIALRLSKIVNNRKNFPGASPQTPPGLAIPGPCVWGRCLLHFFLIIVLKLLSDCQKMAKILKIFRRPLPTKI